MSVKQPVLNNVPKNKMHPIRFNVAPQAIRPHLRNAPGGFKHPMATNVTSQEIPPPYRNETRALIPT